MTTTTPPATSHWLRAARWRVAFLTTLAAWVGAGLLVYLGGVDRTSAVWQIHDTLQVPVGAVAVAMLGRWCYWAGRRDECAKGGQS